MKQLNGERAGEETGKWVQSGARDGDCADGCAR